MRKINTLALVFVICLISTMIGVPIFGQLYKKHQVRREHSEFIQYFGIPFPLGGMDRDRYRSNVVSQLIQNKKFLGELQSKLAEEQKEILGINTDTVEGVYRFAEMRKSIDKISEELGEFKAAFNRMCKIAHDAGYKLEVNALGWRPSQDDPSLFG